MFGNFIKYGIYSQTMKKGRLYCCLENGYVYELDPDTLASINRKITYKDHFHGIGGITNCLYLTNDDDIYELDLDTLTSLKQISWKPGSNNYLGGIGGTENRLYSIEKHGLNNEITEIDSNTLAVLKKGNTYDSRTHWFYGVGGTSDRLYACESKVINYVHKVGFIEVNKDTLAIIKSVTGEGGDGIGGTENRLYSCRYGKNDKSMVCELNKNTLAIIRKVESPRGATSAPRGIGGIK